MISKWETVNPANRQVLRSWETTSQGDLDQVILRLHDGFLKWKKTSFPERVSVLLQVQNKLKSLQDQLALSMTLQMGKPISQSQVEVRKCIETFHFIEQLSLKGLEEKTKIIGSGVQQKKYLIQRQPLGVIWGIMPWNFPLWQALRMILPTLLSGNVVLLKHSELTPEIGEFLNQIFDQVWDYPIFQHRLISHDLTPWVLEHKFISGVSLTGSTRAGAIVAELAGKHIKKSVFELGGSDPYLVFKDADLDLAAEKIIQSRLNNTGQVCIAAKRVLIDDFIYEEFLSKLVDQMKHRKIGDPLQKETALGPLAHHRFVTDFENQKKLLLTTGAKLQYESNDLPLLDKDFTRGSYVEKSIFSIDMTTHVLEDLEIFAPCLLVDQFQTLDEAVVKANATQFGLGAGVFTRDQKKSLEVAQQIRAGHVAINSTVQTDFRIPFGGYQKSGYGIEIGEEGLLEFTQTFVISGQDFGLDSGQDTFPESQR